MLTDTPFVPRPDDPSVLSLDPSSCAECGADLDPRDWSCPNCSVPLVAS